MRGLQQGQVREQEATKQVQELELAPVQPVFGPASRDRLPESLTLGYTG